MDNFIDEFNKFNASKPYVPASPDEVYDYEDWVIEYELIEHEDWTGLIRYRLSVLNRHPDSLGNRSGYVVKTEITPLFATSDRWQEEAKEQLRHVERLHARPLSTPTHCASVASMCQYRSNFPQNLRLKFPHLRDKKSEPYDVNECERTSFA
jgi:hypothetical protein